jgi:hypothetical protein
MVLVVVVIGPTLSRTSATTVYPREVAAAATTALNMGHAATTTGVKMLTALIT